MAEQNTFQFMLLNAGETLSRKQEWKGLCMTKCEFYVTNAC